MWIMTPFGIIMPAARPSDTIDMGDNRELQIRARDKQTLLRLKKWYMPTTLGTIIKTDEMDYEYRAYCTHAAFAQALTRLTEEINYEKFKPAVFDALPKKEAHALHDLYVSIWAVVATHFNSPVLHKKAKKH